MSGRSFGMHIVTTLALIAGVSAAFAEETLHLEIALPPGGQSNSIIWGLTRGGAELRRGELQAEQRETSGSQEVVESKPEPTGEISTLRRFDVSTFDLTIPDPVAEPGAPLLHLCVNNDAYDSYVPSFGDAYQVVPVRFAEGRWIATAAAGEWKERKAASPSSALTIHYHRFDDDYDAATLWTWDSSRRRQPAANELLPVGRDAFGLVFQLDVAEYDEGVSPVGLLPRLRGDWNLKDAPDRFWAPPRGGGDTGGRVYLVQDSGEVMGKKPDLRPKLARASWDAERQVSVVFAQPLRMKDWPAERLRLIVQAPSAKRGDEPRNAETQKHKNAKSSQPESESAGETCRAAHSSRLPAHSCQIVSAEPILPKRGTCLGYRLTTADPLENSEYVVRAEGLGEVPVRPGRILQDPRRYGDPNAKMGADYSPAQTTFRVFAPSATAVRVVIADGPATSDRVVEHDLKSEGRGLWAATVRGDLEGKLYAYKLTGREFDPNLEITDIYATCTLDGTPRSLIVDLSKTNPPGWAEKKPPRPVAMTDAVIYEMHVRDFSIAASSGIERKGRYLGIAEAGTHLPDDDAVKTGLDHLVELGVTHVQLLPVQQFERHGDRYDWGYMPQNYNSPQGWYASDASGPARIRELKAAIHALHARGIGVIMDVVYNHTSPQPGFDQLAPGYYYRFTPAGRYSNGSGCGNEFNSAAPMARKFIVDSLKYWATEYGIDGFRFDIMALIDKETMMQIRDELRKLRPGILLYGEPWSAGPTDFAPLTDKAHVRGTGIGAFNDDFRNAIKGNPDEGPGAFVQSGVEADVIAKGLAGSIEIWTRDPADSINYFEAHDNLTAWDKLLQSSPGASEPDRKRMMRLAALTLLTAQGVPFLHAGQEFCRSKGGNRNSYNAPDSVNAIDWTLKARNRAEFEYTRELIALRKAHPALRLRTGDEVKARVRFDKPPAKTCVVYRVDGKGLKGEPAGTLLVLLNGDVKDHAFKLPEGKWKVHADADRASVTPLGEVEAKVSVPAHGGMLLIQQ